MSRPAGSLNKPKTGAFGARPSDVTVIPIGDKFWIVSTCPDGRDFGNRAELMAYIEKTGKRFYQFDSMAEATDMLTKLRWESW